MGSTETKTAWRIKAKYYEFCSCQPGCTCNFSGFPTSPDGSCKAAVATHITEGRCGDVDLANVKACAIIDWPKAIHEGNGKAVFVVPESVTDEQVTALSQIFTGQLGGMPWAILGETFEVAGLVRADVNIEDNGIESGFTIPGVGKAKGTTLRNPVTKEPHSVAIDLDAGFIWKRGQCGKGSFQVAAEGINLDFQDSNWIIANVDWTNQE